MCIFFVRSEAFLPQNLEFSYQNSIHKARVVAILNTCGDSSASLSHQQHRSVPHTEITSLHKHSRGSPKEVTLVQLQVVSPVSAICTDSWSVGFFCITVTHSSFIESCIPFRSDHDITAFVAAYDQDNHRNIMDVAIGWISFCRCKWFLPS